MALSKLQREIVSRSAAAVVAAGLLFGAYECFAASARMSREHRERQARLGVPSHPRPRAGGSGAYLPLVGGCVLLVPGGILVLVAFTPSRFIERVLGPPKPTPLWERPGRDNWDSVGTWWWS